MSSFCAGIVTYQPDIKRLLDSISTLRNQVDKIYIVDNNSKNLKLIQGAISGLDKIEIINNDHNNGIAKALNQMCSRALESGYKWILSLDQDTIVPDNIIELLSKYTSQKRAGIICPAVYYDGWDYTTKGTSEVELVKACMTSASLTRLSAWKRVNGFREEYFIDYVDNEYCMKLSLKGYKILKVNTCEINHQLGESGVKSILGKKIRFCRHNPQRLYYMARNNYIFIREYSRNLNVIKEVFKLFYVLFLELVFSKNKKQAEKMINKGFQDARRGILGEYKES